MSSFTEKSTSSQLKTSKTNNVIIFLISDEFKVRDAKLNPILKNTLFEMMNKDSMKRLELNETKRRLSLQKYIASESKKWLNSINYLFVIFNINQIYSSNLNYPN